MIVAGGLPCDNGDGNEAVFMLSNLAGTEHQWVCGFCLGMLGLATLVEIGAFTQDQVDTLMSAGYPAAEPAVGEPADTKPRRARKKTAGKVTGDTGETTPPEQYPCDGGMDGCLGAGVHQVHDKDGQEGWLCHVCYGALGAATPSIGSV